MSDPAGFFNEAYRGSPPWDIGRPQSEIVRLEEEGLIVDPVLDVGCGTGENALFLAERGHRVTGLDSAPLAIEKAREKAGGRNASIRFEVWDALELSSLGETFATAIDSGLFHVFSDQERPTFAGSLHAALDPGGRYFLMCFSERQPGTWGPRRVTRDEIHATFADGWQVEDIRPSFFEVALEYHRVEAWLATITRL